MSYQPVKSRAAELIATQSAGIYSIVKCIPEVIPTAACHEFYANACITYPTQTVYNAQNT